jgi:mRNA interferase MazF
VIRGEVWWVEHPDAGRRPACVLTRHAAIPVLNSVLVAPADPDHPPHPHRSPLTRHDGMPDDCAVSLDSLTTVPRPVHDTDHQPPRATLAELCAALHAATGC